MINVEKLRYLTLIIWLKIVMFGIYDEYQSYIKHLKIFILFLSLFNA